MTQFQVVDSTAHKHTKINTQHGAEYGENIHYAPAVADELRHLALEYPVCFIKDSETGQFGMHAVFGFDPGENLFLKGNQWHANYVPMHIRRQPFMVGVKGPAGAQPTPENTVLTLNMSNARVQTVDGEPLFDAQGQATPYLQKVSQLAFDIVPAILRTEQFIKTLVANRLIEPIQLTITLKNGEETKFEGIYTINEEKLSQLSQEKVFEFHEKGYFQACYLILASFGNIQNLITLKSKI
ncbi:SapC family protein [Echinimonas agarilytica]|uniref:SapC family protein n=1 Tax=Echinimonas agarilytica TaxID=1215918 RepID=A0AA41W7S0_9GAMM|nr:SapC family protein [Echinimonas agarilytica]